jgi:hypothetical protein
MRKVDERSQDPLGRSLMKEVVEWASGDYEKATLLGITKWEHVFIIFDYDKSDHLDPCRELAFGIKEGITSEPVPAQYIHSTAKRMKEDSERLNTKFLHHGQLCSKATSCP